MPKIDESKATIRVFTFKEGLLAAVAHDLELDVRSFSIEASEGRDHVVVDVDASSLRVLHAMKDGRPAPTLLSAKDLGKIEETMQKDVLDTRRHPRVRFEAKVRWEGALPSLEGTLTLAGRTRALPVSVKREREHLVATARVHQPDFGIAPYSAMLGSLKVKPEVQIEARLPASLGARPDAP